MTFIEFAEKVLGIELLDWQKAVLEEAQKCKDEGKDFYIHTYARQGKILLNSVIQQKLGYDRGFEDGRSNEQLQSIEDAKTQATEYLDALDKAKEEAYKQGKADQKKEDNEFFNFDKVIEIEKNKSYNQGAKEFAEWLPQHFDLRFSNNPDVWLDEFFNHTKEKVLSKQKKEVEQ